jgi:hypothetical protein
MPSNPASLRLAELYQDRAVAVAEQAQRAARRLVVVDRDDPVESWRRVITSVSVLIGAAQTASTDLALGYFRALGTLETGRSVDVAESRPRNIGFTEDGRAIQDVLVAPRARFFRRLDEGVEVPRLLTEAVEAVGRAAQFEVMDAGQRELAHQVSRSGLAQGWRTRSRGTCGACLAIDDGSVTSRRPPFHPHCDCVIEIDFGGPQEARRPSGRERFEALSPQAQDAALGFEKAELLRRRLISWEHLVSVQTFKEWTPVITEAPLESLLAIAGATAEQLLPA